MLGVSEMLVSDTALILSISCCRHCHCRCRHRHLLQASSSQSPILPFRIRCSWDSRCFPFLSPGCWKDRRCHELQLLHRRRCQWKNSDSSLPPSRMDSVRSASSPVRDCSRCSPSIWRCRETGWIPSSSRGRPGQKTVWLPLLLLQVGWMVRDPMGCPSWGPAPKDLVTWLQIGQIQAIHFLQTK